MSDGFVATARATIQDRRAEFQVGDAQALPLETASRDIVVSADVELRSRQAESGGLSSIFTEAPFIRVSRFGSAETSSADHTVA